MIKKLLGWLSGTSKTVLEFIGPILQKSVSELLAKILPIAFEVVKSLATDSGKSGAADTAMYCGATTLNVTGQPLWVTSTWYREASGNGSTVVSTGYTPYIEIIRVS